MSKIVGTSTIQKEFFRRTPEEYSRVLFKGILTQIHRR
ncbi:hypothetical protein LEP1GSC168_2697 [Leptospira santarosai str. HAI134]|nr:hypothetical protein LEP1GSC168_2697 [Leptospira santarosai str. HAI134]